MDKRGQLHWLQKIVQLYVSLWENDSTSPLIFYFGKQFLNEFLVLIGQQVASTA